MPLTLRIGVFSACLLPFAWLIYAIATNALGPDPAEAVMHVTGEWSLRMLALTLLLSPLRQWTGWAPWMKLRRMLGLYAFFYACLHLFSFLQLFIGWTPARIWEELVERPYITAGFAAWLMLLPLALTSTRGMQRRMRRRWLQLHRLIYPTAVAACLHLLWQARSDIGEALVYIVIFALLLGWRLRRYQQRRRRSIAA